MSRFRVAAPQPVVVSLPDFTRGPGQPVDVPADGNKLPLIPGDQFALELAAGAGPEAVSDPGAPLRSMGAGLRA